MLTSQQDHHHKRSMKTCCNKGYLALTFIRCCFGRKGACATTSSGLLIIRRPKGSAYVGKELVDSGTRLRREALKVLNRDGLLGTVNVSDT